MDQNPWTYLSSHTWAWHSNFIAVCQVITWHHTQITNKQKPETIYNMTPDICTPENDITPSWITPLPHLPHKPSNLLRNPNMNPSPVNLNPILPMKPLWNLEDWGVPLKEEYLLFQQGTTIFHHQMLGFLENHPELSPKVPELPDTINTFTDKALILMSTCDFWVHNDHLHFLYVEGQTRAVTRAVSVDSTATPCGKIDLNLSFWGVNTKWGVCAPHFLVYIVFNMGN